MRRLQVVVLILGLATAAFADDAARPETSPASASTQDADDPEEDFAFVGPAPMRNFQPIQLIFLNLPFERSRTAPEGDFALHFWTAESNVIATTQGHIESTLKFETNWTVFGARYGFAPDWEIGADLPFISRWGGFLDPVIDGVESLFGTVNPERKIFPKNTFGEFLVKEGDTTLFHGRPEAFEPGDLWISMKRQVRLESPWPLFSLRGAVKVPTGNVDSVNGSGKPDFGLGVTADYRAFDRLMIYMNVSLIYPLGPITPANLTLNPFVTESFALELAIVHWLTAQIHQATYTSPMHDTGTALLDDAVVELGFGLNAYCGPHVDLQLIGVNNVSGVEQAADFTLMLATTFRP